MCKIYKLLSSTMVGGLFMLALLRPADSRAQVSLSAGNLTYTQNFNGLATSGTTNADLPAGFLLQESGGGGRDNEQYAADAGTGNTGDTYSYGSTGNADRALGGLASGTLQSVFGVVFSNNTGTSITSLNITYTGEQWRVGGGSPPAGPQRLTFAYVVGTSPTLSSTATPVEALDFISPISGVAAGALDGNLAANRTTLTQTITFATPVEAGQQILLRWTDANDTGNDHGLAIDDLTVTASTGGGVALPTVTVAAIDASAAEAGPDPGTYRFSRTGATTDPLTVAYTVGGTASNGTDYTPTLTGTITIAAGAASADITITPVDDPDSEGAETVTLTLASSTNYAVGASPDNLATVVITDNESAPVTRIRTIQGTSHRSPLFGQTVTNVTGIVTARASNGFYMQDPEPDDDDRTSEGIFVFTGSGTAPASTILVGDGVQVSGVVGEFGTGTNLTITQITSPTVTELSEGQTLPAATIVGAGGRAIPTTIIEDDNFSSFDPATDGIDFYESLEGMRVQINNPVAASPTVTSGAGQGEVWVLADNGANVTGRSARGGIVISAADFNPERIQIDDNLLNPPSNSFVTPVVNTGALFTTITGIVNYAAGNYEVLATSLPVVVSNPLTKEVTDLTGTASQLTFGTFNVENLDPGDGTFSAIAGRIVTNLRSPDILLLEEIQDNNGPTNNGVVDASTTFGLLINAITTAGGPTYEYRQIDPVNNQDGGEPGGNIRVGFLFNPARVTFVDRPGGTSTSATTVNNVGGKPQLSFSPGRVEPTNPAFDGAGANSASRKPLAGEFLFNGQTVFVIGNHLVSKGGDNPLFGNVQPPVLSSETQRNQQATVIRDFVRAILAVDASANVIVAGDLNDFEFASPLNILKAAPLTALIETLPVNERYTYNFEGNAQAIDHILVSSNLTGNRLDRMDVVHINSEFNDQDSDHDPSVARFNLAPVATPLTLTMPLYNCQTGAITFRTSGGDGTPIEFFGLGITPTWTTNPNGTIDAEKRSDPNSGTTILLRARQSGAEVTYEFDFGAYCRTQGTNLPPAVNLTLPDQTGTVGQFFSYKLPDGTFSDPESQPLTLSAAGLPAGLSQTPPDLRLISGIPTQAGSFTATITATDPQNAANSLTLVFTIQSAAGPTPGNGALAVNKPIPNQSALVGQSFSFTIPADAFSGSVASVDVSDLPRGLMYTSSTRTISGVVSQPDQRYINVTASDGQGNSVRSGFLLTFSTGAQGSLAVAQTIPDQTGTVGQFFRFAIPAGTFSGPVTAVDMSDLPRGLFYYSDTRLFDGTVSQPDQRYITVTAVDGQGNQVQTTFLLTFTSPNQSSNSGSLAVAQSIPNQTGTVGQPFSFAIPAGTFSGPVAGIDVSDLPRGLMYLNQTIMGTVSQPDQRVITVTAIDGAGQSVRTSFTLTFTNPNGRLAAAAEPGTTLAATLLPNPVGEEFTVRISGAMGKTVGIVLTDLAGNALLNSSVPVTTADQLERVRLGSRPAGLYLLRLSAGQQTVVLKVVKQ